jgi:hypothetical protein
MCGFSSIRFQNIFFLRSIAGKSMLEIVEAEVYDARTLHSALKCLTDA